MGGYSSSALLSLAFSGNGKAAAFVSCQGKIKSYQVLGSYSPLFLISRVVIGSILPFLSAGDISSQTREHGRGLP